MDNHKDFIHIDDLFKDLRNGEEPEPSGAWLRMKDLLDKEMPVGAPVVSAGKSFRRYIIPLVALLLAGGGFTYYKMNQEGKKDAAFLNPSASVVASKVTHADKAVGLESENSGRKSNTGNRMKSNETAQNGVGISPANHTGSSGAALASRTEHGSHNSTNYSGTVPGTKGNAGKRKVTPVKTEGNKSNAAGGHKTPANIAKAAKDENAGNQVSQTPVIQQNVIEQIKPSVGGTSGTSTATTATVAVADKANVTGTKGTVKPVFENQHSKGNFKPVTTSLNNDKIVQASDGKMYKEVRDTFKRIDVVARLNPSSNSGRQKAPKNKMDTVAITRIERVTYVPLTALEMVQLQKMKVASSARALVPIANLREKIVANEMVSMVPLSNYKVASRRVDPSKFNQLVQNTSQGISNYFDGSRSFYAAILMGGNSSFGNPGAFGLQIGIAGLYQLSERITLAAELKFVNHYFSNYSLEDRSVTFENISSQQLSSVDWLFSGTQKTITSAYRINSFNSLEMPVSLSYNLGRVSVFGGLNLAYAFPIKWNKENTVSSLDVQKNNTENTNPFLVSSFKIDEQNDFSSRFGVGYVWGMNYDFSRKISLDARMTQILWDNNQSSTDALKRLFHVPTLQISIGYFFGRKDKVVYIMDKR